MRFACSEEQLAVQQACRQMLRAHCTADHVHAAWTSQAGRVPGLWGRLTELGVPGLMAPEWAEGLALGEEELALVLEECGRVGTPEPVIEHVAVAVPLLAEAIAAAERAQADGAALETARAALRAAAAGEALLAVGLRPGEPVSYAGQADHALLVDRATGALHLVPRAALTVEEQTSVDRTRRPGLVTWQPDAATLLLAGEAAGELCARALDRGAFASAAFLVGLADRMVQLGVEYAKVREQFGKAIGSFQAVQHRIVNACIALEMARPVVWRAAWSLASGQPEASLHCSMARIHGVEAAERAAREILQIHGAIGYTTEYELHLWMKRTWSLASAWGTVREHEQRVERALLGAE